jgi:bacterioferritin (cytochrome b1)
MAADPRIVLLMSYYRDAELRGANLLFRLMSHLDDTDSQVKLSLHLADETRHAWLWTKQITDMGGSPVRVADGYQTRIGLRVVPKNLIDILALTIVVEERAYQRYVDHAQRPDTHPAILETLREVTKDEKWHIAWMKAKLDELAKAQGAEDKAREAIERYRKIDEDIYGQLLAKEQALFAHAPAEQAS